MATPEHESLAKDNAKQSPLDDSTSSRLPSEQEAELLSESNALKTTANALFTSASYNEAITGYTRAVDTLPTYLDYELAVLKSNIAACHLKLEEWKSAVDAATEALENLEQLDPLPQPSKGQESEDKLGEAAGAVVEISDAEEARLETLQRSGKTLSDVHNLRIKALLRRAKARRELDGWANLQGALEDYTLLSALPNLSPIDRKTVDKAKRELPPKLDERKNTEMADMMGKLKDLGNGILKPFGLSTDNFQFVKDERTGGYSMNFNQ